MSAPEVPADRLAVAGATQILMAAAFEAIDAENERSDVAEFIKRIVYVYVVDDPTVDDDR
jgi:hypothetical protein